MSDQTHSDTIEARLQALEAAVGIDTDDTSGEATEATADTTTTPPEVTQ